jgi:hypothetical protein
MKSAIALAALFILSTACGVDDEPVPGDELAEEAAEADQADDKNDTPGWTHLPALQLGEQRFGAVSAGERDVLPMWVAGSAAKPLSMTFSVKASEDAGAVRVAVLGPLVGGTRAVLGAAGYGAPSPTAEVTIDVAQTGQILVVVGSYQLADFAAYTATVGCGDGSCGPDDVDALASPKLGALIGETTAGGEQLVRARLNAALAGEHVEVELRRSRPNLRWQSEVVATSVSSGDQVNFLLPAGTLAEGDDLSFVVAPSARMTIADDGVWARFAPNQRVFARVDSIFYTDLGGVEVSGVTGYFEGDDVIELRDAAGTKTLAWTIARAALPGTEGIGFGLFDVLLAPELFLADGTLNPELPKNGDVLSIGRLLGEDDDVFQRLGCFEYCNDLSGMETCVGQARPCP